MMELRQAYGQWYWVNPKFPDSPLSPMFCDSPPALQWRGRVGQENFGDIEVLERHIEELNTGFRVVLPCSREHAEAMLRVATLYLERE